MRRPHLAFSLCTACLLAIPAAGEATPATDHRGAPLASGTPSSSVVGSESNTRVLRPTGTILVANMDDDSVWLLDAESGALVGLIRTHIAPHEIAVSSDGRLAAIANYGDERGPGNLLQMVDVGAGDVVYEIEVDGYERLHSAAFLPGDSLLLLSSERTREVLVVGVEDGEVRRTISTDGGGSHMVALGDDWAWTANIPDGTVSRIDPSGTHPTVTFPAGTRTEGVATTPDGSEGWTGSMQGGEVVGIDADGNEVARVAGLSVPYRLAITSDGGTVVVTDPQSHQVGLIDRATATLNTIDVGVASAAHGLGSGPSPQGFTLSPDGRWAFVSTKAIDRVAIIDLVEREVVAFYETGDGPDGIAFSPVRVGSE